MVAENRPDRGGTGSRDQAGKPPEPPSNHILDVEGGEVSDMGDAKVPEFNPIRHRHETAARIAVTLVWILAGTVGLHVSGVIAAAWLGLPALMEQLTEMIKFWLPVLAGLVGSAVAFYFSKE